MVAEPTLRSSVRGAGPCADLLEAAEHTCADAEQKAAAAAEQQRRVRDLRADSAIIAQEREAGARMRDRRTMAAAKEEAAAAYRHALTVARGQAELQTAATEWLRQVDRLNRNARVAGTLEHGLARRAMELHQLLPAAEMAADAARIASQVAQERCAEAKLAAIECEEASAADPAVETATLAAETPATIVSDAQAPVDGTGTAATTAATFVAELPGEPLHAAIDSHPPVERLRGAGLIALLGGERPAVLRLALQLAGETGLEPGRLQLLLLELREAVLAGALANGALQFPPQHPFWSQFGQAAATRVVATLASLGFRFDGVSGWEDGRVPQIRDLALALSYAGLDPRSLRRPAGQAAIDTLWQGTALVPADWLLERAPGLDLDGVKTALGERAARLTEVWAIWEQVRPLLAR
jgi:hypothetical protein